MSRVLTLAIVALALGCGGDDAKDDPAVDSADTDTTNRPLGACFLAQRNQTCPSCSDGERTCSYGDISVTRGSCGDCQAKAELYQALCDAEVADTVEAIEAGLTCTD